MVSVAQWKIIFILHASSDIERDLVNDLCCRSVVERFVKLIMLISELVKSYRL